jgi:hypothetical protein
MKKVFMIMAVASMFLVACNDYGKKKTFGKGDLYYTENITESEADSALEFFKEMKYLSDDKSTSMQIDKQNGIYKIRLVVGDEYQNTDTSLDNQFKLVSTLASMKVFDGKPVEVDLCDDQLETKRTLK